MALPLPGPRVALNYFQSGVVSGNPPSIGTLLTGEMVVSIPNVRKDNVVVVTGPNLTAGLYVTGTKVTANADTNNVTVTILNNTVGTVNDGAQNFLYVVL